ncbi:MAG: hypothetical protein AAFZ52_00715 [Bacteroidota bacterium]
MHLLRKAFLLFACLTFATAVLSAQDGEQVQSYNVHDYLQVAPGNHADYLALEKAWKKIHQANIAAGHYQYWELNRIVMPTGSSTEYNYVTRIVVRGEEKLAALLTGTHFGSDMAKLLTTEEKALFARTGELRTYVKKEIYTVAHLLAPSEGFDDVTIAVHNTFTYPEGSNHATHLAMEKEIWDPVHAARMKDGALLGWVVANKMMPSGAGEPFHDVTVDLYKDLPTFLANRSPMDHFRQVHAGKDIDELMAQTIAAATLTHREVRQTLDTSRKE